MAKKTTRFRGKTEFDRAINNLDKAMVHFKNLLDIGYCRVPRIEKVIEVSTQMLLEVQDLLKKARDSI